MNQVTNLPVDYKSLNQHPAVVSNSHSFNVSLFNKPVDDIQGIVHQEEEILGFILSNSKDAQQIFEQITVKQFNHKLHCIIFEAAKHLFDNGKSNEYFEVCDYIISNESKYKELYNLFAPDPFSYLLSLTRKTSLKTIESFKSRIKYLIEPYLNHEVNLALKNRDIEKAEKAIAELKSLNSALNKSAISLKKFGLTERLEELEMRAKEEKFVLNGIALTGQITVLYAPPNTGKTLIALRLITQQIVQHGLNPDNVIYINVDDTNKGLRTKIGIAKEFGFEMLADNEGGFNVKELTNILKAAISNDACNEIIVLDTLKKVVDLMDKRQGS